MTATTEPTSFTAGDTIAWTKTLADYPANAGWVLAYVLINSATRITITAAASGADHLVNVPAATSAAYAPGNYTYRATVTRALDRYTIGSGQITVAPDLSAAGATTFDSRSSARKALDAANLTLETYGNKAYLQGFEINGRKQQFHTPSDFLAFRSKLVLEVAREDAAARIAAGLKPRNQLAVRFTTR